jgi:AraC-like DNA-binding protein
MRLLNGDRAEPVEIWKARKFIQEHSSEELSLTRVAQAVNISGNYLSEKFKNVTGLNFVEYVACVRFEKACELLETVDRRISEIAFAVGFQSLSQFNRVFKKLTPTIADCISGRAGKATAVNLSRGGKDRTIISARSGATIRAE